MAIYALFLLTAIFPLVVLLAVQQWKKSSTSQHNLPPGPTKLPLIGNLHQLMDADGLLHRSFARLASTYGPIVYLLLGRVPAVVVSSQDLVKELFTAAGMDLNVSDRPKIIAFHTLTYGSSEIGAAPYGDLWRKLKKVSVVGLLSYRKVERFRQVREEQVGKMMNSLHAHFCEVDGSVTCGSEEGVVVDVGELVRYLTLGIMLRLVLGRTYRSDDEGKEGNVSCRQQDLFTRSLHLVHQVETMLGAFFFEDFFPKWGLGQWVDAVTGRRRRLRKLFDDLDAVYEKILQRHEKAAVGLEEGAREEDFVNFLREEQCHDSGVTRVHVKAVIADMLMAGSEPTSATLSWAMAELVRNPKVMETAQREVRGIVGDRGGQCGNGEGKSRLLVTESDLPRLPYLKAVVKETLRLHMASPLLLPRATRADCRLGGYSIPAGARIFVNAWAIARDAACWDAPEKFRPERFVADVEYSDVGGAAQDGWRFLPFGAGRRSCPAARLAAVMMELALANLICGFDWKLPDGVEELDVAEAPGLAVGMKSGLVLKAIRYVQT